MEKKTKTFTQLITIALAYMVAIMYLCFSSCKKKEILAPTFYKVTFDAQGAPEIGFTTVKPGSSITLPATPKKVGATFDGWFTDKEGKNLFSEKTAINADLTLYAKWNEQLYTVTFDLNINGGESSTINPITGVKYGSNIIFPPEPTRKDYLFDGWYANKEANGASFSEITSITDNITLYAKWVVYRAPAFELFCNSFKNNEKIPPKHASINWDYPDRWDISPALHWINPPKKTKSFLIIMENILNPNYQYMHWTVYAIPVRKRSLKENDPWLPKRNIAWRKGAYHGPFRDPFDQSREETYQIKIYALDLEPDYFDYTNYPELTQEAEKRLGDHILASANIIGKF